MTVNSPPYALQNGSHSAALFRQASTSFIGQFGVCGAGEYQVTQTGTPSMAIAVNPGRAWVPGGSVSNISGYTFSTQAAYFALNDASVTVTVAPSDATNPRIDTTYLAVNDSYYSGSLNSAVLGIVTGTPAASPVAPSAPVNSITLATVAVAANSTSIVNANITGTQSLLQVVNFTPWISPTTIGAWNIPTAGCRPFSYRKRGGKVEFAGVMYQGTNTIAANTSSQLTNVLPDLVGTLSSTTASYVRIPLGAVSGGTVLFSVLNVLANGTLYVNAPNGSSLTNAVHTFDGASYADASVG